MQAFCLYPPLTNIFAALKIVTIHLELLSPAALSGQRAEQSARLKFRAGRATVGDTFANQASLLYSFSKTEPHGQTRRSLARFQPRRRAICRADARGG